MKTIFVWGAGGVGKSHYCLRLAARSEGIVKILTLDPSRRLFQLAAADPSESSQEICVAGKSFELIATDAARLFDDLHKKKSSKPTVELLYQQMVKGLKEFRNYMDLIQIGDEIHRSRCDILIIDTPPFQEALGLYRAMQHLQKFFETSLVAWALKINQNSLLQKAFRRLFDLLRFFSGKAAATHLFDFITWMSEHNDRFANSAQALQTLLTSSSTTFAAVLQPETSLEFLKLFAQSFSHQHTTFFVMNRSVAAFTLPDRSDAFLNELRRLRKGESSLHNEIKRLFPTSNYETIPLMFMGEDTLEELERYIAIR